MGTAVYSLQDLLFSVSLAAYVVTSVIVAAVRWGHKCPAFASHADYYYPAWKVIVGCYFVNLLMAPAIFLPHEADAILQLRMLLILASPFFCALLMFSYFGKMLGKSSWRWPVYALIGPFAAMALAATALIFIPGTQLEGDFCRVFFAVGGIMALAFLVCFILALGMVVRELRRSMMEEYSNPNDFPHQYAAGAIWICLVHLAVSWVVASVGTPLLLSIGFVLMSAFSVILLISILPTHRTLDVEKLEKAVAAEMASAAEEVPPQSVEHADEILRAIRRFVEQEQGYLDEHLTLTSLARSIGYNRTYVSAVLTDHLGGFFVYVNRCRLSHAARLQVEEPGISTSELIDRSGFSRTTYYKVKKELEQ